MEAAYENDIKAAHIGVYNIVVPVVKAQGDGSVSTLPVSILHIPFSSF